MGAHFAKWLYSFDIQELRNDLDDLIDRVDEIALKVREFAQDQSSVREEQSSLSTVIQTNKQKLGEVMSIADQLGELETQMKDMKKMLQTQGTTVNGLHTRIDINTSRSQINYKNIGIAENSLKARMDKMQSDIDHINTMTRHDHDTHLEKRKSILKK
jgi:cell shape-determining protein MreC